MVVCVSAPEGQVMDRLGQRGLRREEAQRRLAAQMPTREKEALADYVICNDGTREQLKSRTMSTWKTIMEKETRHDG